MFSAASRVSTSIRHSRSSTSRSASRSRRRESGRPASNATVPRRASSLPRSSPGARSCSARSRYAAAARGTPPRAASAAARISRSETSGSACGPHSSRWQATTPGSAPESISARAASRCSRSRSVRDRSSAIATAIRPWANRSPPGSSSPATSSASRAGPSSPTGTPATAASTCGGAPSPITANAETTPRSRGHSSARRRRTTVRAIAVTGGASCSGSSSASGPCAAIWRPSSPSSQGLPPTARWQSRQTAAGVSGASRRISCMAPRGVSGCGCRTVAERAEPSMREHVRGGVGIVGAGADQDQQRQVLDAPGEIGENLERGAIGPLGIVDHQRQRALLGDRRAQPEDAVRDQHRRVAGGRRALQQQLARGGGRSVEQVLALLERGLADRALEQCPHDAEGEVALERPGGGAPDEVAGLRRERRAVLEQRGLAEPGRRLEHDDAAPARAEAIDGGAQHIELDGALDQRRRSGWQRYDVQVGPAERGGHSHRRRLLSGFIPAVPNIIFCLRMSLNGAARLDTKVVRR